MHMVVCINRKHADPCVVGRMLQDARFRDRFSQNHIHKLSLAEFNDAHGVTTCAKTRHQTRRRKRRKLRRLAHHGNECALAHARSSTGPHRKTARKTRHSGLRIGCNSRGDPRGVDT
jgi:hypothetical protein